MAMLNSLLLVDVHNLVFLNPHFKSEFGPAFRPFRAATFVKVFDPTQSCCDPHRAVRDITVLPHCRWQGLADVHFLEDLYNKCCFIEVISAAYS